MFCGLEITGGALGVYNNTFVAYGATAAAFRTCHIDTSTYTAIYKVSPDLQTSEVESEAAFD